MVAGIGGDGAAAGFTGERVVDLRSDTVTKPTAGMRKAMAEAAVGDDVFGDDPTVIALEARVAEMLGKEAGLFVPSGTMSNLLAVGTHCSGRGEEVILGKDSHIFFYEQGGASSLMGVVLNTVPNLPDGTLDLDEVLSVIKPSSNPHFAAAKLLALENTHNKKGGSILPPGYMAKAGAFCREHGLKLHVDGARLWNAAAASGASMRELGEQADSLSVCLSKGLGAPVGSVLVGERQFIEKARRLRKAVGGGMRQAGILAAAGLYALDHHCERLKEDHAHAQRMGSALEAMGSKVLPVHTNIVMFDVRDGPKFVEDVGAAGVEILCVDGKSRCRATLNLMVTSEDVDRTLVEFEKAMRHQSGGSPAPQARL